MNPLIASLILLSSLAILFYILYQIYFSIKLGKKKGLFSCNQCGKCCKIYNVTPTAQDIQRIESSGLKSGDFMEGSRLKRLADGSCTFLRKTGDKYYCGIYEHRPDACRKWPFSKVAGIEMANTSYPKMCQIKVN